MRAPVRDPSASTAVSRPGTSAARSPTRTTAPGSASAAATSSGRASRAAASSPGAVRTRWPPVFTTAGVLHEPTCTTRVPWRAALRSRRKTIGDSSSGSNATHSTVRAASRWA